MHDCHLLVMVAPAELKDDLVDALIGMECVGGFTLGLVEGYSRAHSHFNLREQVQGHRAFCRFEVLHAPDDLVRIRGELDRVCGTESVRYWLLPVAGQGHLGDAKA
ncbi:MAG: DUF3240 family protein [Halioglobus sp.]|nr:DUF3240 family protein [Halioglobus sp.]